MSDKSSIEWTDATWNPLRGCSKVSPGCEHCYAMHVAARFSGPGQPYEGLAKRGPTNWTGQVRLVEEKLFEPVGWKRPRRIFVNSMSDLFHESVDVETIAAIFGVMAACPRHTFQVLTKRAGRMNQVVREITIRSCFNNRHVCLAPDFSPTWPLPNVWLGVSVEDQQRADERIPELLKTPAAVRWLSCEPLLGAVDLSEPLGLLNRARPFPDRAGNIDAPDESWLDWIIVGGESGQGARPMHPDWARSLRDQCNAADVPFFFKQWGEWQPLPSGFGFRKVGKKAAGRLLDGREWNEYPEGKP